MQEIKRNILARVYILYICVIVFSILIIIQILRIQISQGKYWRERAKLFAIKTEVVKAARGNIYADDGKQLLSTSVPIFELRLNASSGLIKDEDFKKTVGKLADSLSDIFKDRSSGEYKNLMMNARDDKLRGGYLLIKREVLFGQLKRIKKFPKFKSGGNAIGLDIKQSEKRVTPYDLLARRTVGFIGTRLKDTRDTVIKGRKIRIRLAEPAQVPVYAGLEGYFSKVLNKLEGTDGKRLVRLAPGGERLPVYNDSTLIEPKNGKDVITTLNIDLQEVAQNSLMENLIINKADHGCVVLMEVATGAVKAIVNLKRDSTNGKTNFSEAYNYAIGEATEPGSTFKLASLLVALEDKVVDTNTRFATGFAKKQFGAKIVSDAHVLPGINTVKSIFEHSSNIGTVTAIWTNYNQHPEKFIEGLYRLNLQKPLGLTILGEKAPDIKDTKSEYWHTPYSLPSMAFGYEIEVTPLQILTLYNAIANNGKMIRPMFVKEIREMGKTQERYYPTVIKQSICSKETIGKLKKMMEGVVERGTAKEKFKGSLYKVAGKTGTAQINYVNRGKEKMLYRASFVGYFPADKPKYSCIVVITNPSAKAYYGGAVAAPVFKDIADKVYSTLLNNYQNVPKSDKKLLSPIKKAVNNNDLKQVNTKLNYPVLTPEVKNDWILTQLDSTLRLTIDPGVKAGTIPDVTGMGMKDAIYLLENAGYKVTVSGRGIVRSQKLIKPKEVTIVMNN
jgi:cell division protein FtsI (penicillin-binding protein 3)